MVRMRKKKRKVEARQAFPNRSKRQGQGLARIGSARNGSADLSSDLSRTTCDENFEKKRDYFVLTSYCLINSLIAAIRQSFLNASLNEMCF